MKWIVFAWFSIGSVLWLITFKLVPVAVFFALGWTGITVSLTPTLLIVWALRSLRRKKE